MQKCWFVSLKSLPAENVSQWPCVTVSLKLFTLSNVKFILAATQQCYDKLLYECNI